MSKRNDITDAYNMGLEYALTLAKKGGVEFLEKEVRYRMTNPLPLNLNRQEVAAVGRSYIHKELDILSTAMAWALSQGIKLPFSTILKYLHIFNDRIDVYRYDNEVLEQDRAKLDRNGAWVDMYNKYYEEVEK